jgi:hypothetical protein
VLPASRIFPLGLARETIGLPRPLCLSSRKHLCIVPADINHWAEPTLIIGAVVAASRRYAGVALGKGHFTASNCERIGNRDAMLRFFVRLRRSHFEIAGWDHTISLPRSLPPRRHAPALGRYQPQNRGKNSECNRQGQGQQRLVRLFIESSVDDWTVAVLIRSNVTLSYTRGTESRPYP